MRKRNGLKRFLSVAVIIALLVSMLPSAVFAVTMPEDSYGVDREWYNFRNNQENNAVADIKTPVDSKTASLKFAVRYGEGWGAAPTPPLILDGALYVGKGNKIYKLDKNTGALLAESDPMFGEVGYAMNPLTYADGMLFCQVGNGVVQAIDYKTLKCAWHTKKIGGQTLSPITYVKAKDGNGYIYYGTWKREVGEDGSFVCVSTGKTDSNIGPSSNGKGGYEKDVVWEFQPSGANKDKIKGLKYDSVLNATLDTAGNTARRGFYWTGAYADTNYVAIGTDDGTEENNYTQSAVFYTLNPLTGDVIDRIDSIKGDIRTTVVYDNGYLYFGTKGGELHKVSVDSNGKLGQDSCVDLGGMTTAAPVVYKNKIYMGVCGKGAQFDADAGHGFAVVDNSKPLLDNNSELYRIPIKGYPQAAALVSTAYVNEDFDENGTPDGRIYIYFTYNAHPGGIYYTYDTPDQKDIAKISKELFIPPKHLQQYCISTISADRDGTLYYKNDSCHIMAVETNPAILETFSLKEDSGKTVELDPGFDSPITDYSSRVSADTKSVSVDLTAPEKAKVTVNGKPYKKGMKVEFESPELALKIKVTLGEFKKTYTVSLAKKTTDASLSELKISESNSYGSKLFDLSPAFDSQVKDYTVDMTKREMPRFFRVWAKTTSDGASLEVAAGENSKKIAGPYGSSDRKYYSVYPENPKKNMSFSIKVKPETAGADTAEYKITVLKEKTDNAASDRLFAGKDKLRFAGLDRYETAIKTADAMKKANAVDKFDTIVVADGLGYADALSGTYLAAVKSAPILTVGKDPASQKKVSEYIAANLSNDGKVYILGGKNAVSSSFADRLNLPKDRLTRLGGLDRYSTNLMILKEAGVNAEDVLVCSGTGFADSLSASATGKPVLLVGKTLTADQKTYLGTLAKKHYYVIGGTKAVSADIEKQLNSYGSKERLTGANRFETSAMVAEKFFGNKAKETVFAYGMNFPDGLSGGPLANSINGPLLLVTSKNTSDAEKYVKAAGIKRSVVLGGEKLISQEAVDSIMR